MRALTWRGLDAPRMEIAYVESLQRARGTQIGIGYELRWELDEDRLHTELVGVEETEFRLGEADFFDLQDSPFFNSLPVMRDGLLHGGPPREYVMRFVRHSPLSESLSQQTYTPLRDAVVRYASGGFEADIQFDRDGFVVLYHGYLERLD